MPEDDYQHEQQAMKRAGPWMAGVAGCILAALALVPFIPQIWALIAAAVLVAGGLACAIIGWRWSR